MVVFIQVVRRKKNFHSCFSLILNDWEKWSCLNFCPPFYHWARPWCYSRWSIIIDWEKRPRTSPAVEWRGKIWSCGRFSWSRQWNTKEKRPCWVFISWKLTLTKFLSTIWLLVPYMVVFLYTRSYSFEKNDCGRTQRSDGGHIFEHGRFSHEKTMRKTTAVDRPSGHKLGHGRFSGSITTVTPKVKTFVSVFNEKTDNGRIFLPPLDRWVHAQSFSSSFFMRTLTMPNYLPAILSLGPSMVTFLMECLHRSGRTTVDESSGQMVNENLVFINFLMKNRQGSIRPVLFSSRSKKKKKKKRPRPNFCLPFDRWMRPRSFFSISDDTPSRTTPWKTLPSGDSAN